MREACLLAQPRVWAGAFVNLTNETRQSRSWTFDHRSSLIDSEKCQNWYPSKNVDLRSLTHAAAIQTPRNFLRWARHDPYRLSCESFPKTVTWVGRTRPFVTAARFRMSGTASSFWADLRRFCSPHPASTRRCSRKSVPCSRRVSRWSASTLRIRFAAFRVRSSMSMHRRSRHLDWDSLLRRSVRASYDFGQLFRSAQRQSRTLYRPRRRSRSLRTGTATSSLAFLHRCFPYRCSHLRSISYLYASIPSLDENAATFSIPHFGASTFSAHKTSAWLRQSFPHDSRCSACSRKCFVELMERWSRYLILRTLLQSDWYVSKTSSRASEQKPKSHASHSSSPFSLIFPTSPRHPPWRVMDLSVMEYDTEIYGLTPPTGGIIRMFPRDSRL